MQNLSDRHKRHYKDNIETGGGGLKLIPFSKSSPQFLKLALKLSRIKITIPIVNMIHNAWKVVLHPILGSNFNIKKINGPLPRRVEFHRRSKSHSFESILAQFQVF